MTILERLADHARERVAADRAQLPLEALQEQVRALGPGDGDAFLAALDRPGVSLLCEVKRASPSKGLIAPEFPYRDIARDYEAGGADALSCLTEPKWFLGSDAIFRDIRGTVSLPMLRKDFTVDPYQIWQARLLGANAVLLICSLLDAPTLEADLALCRELGLAALTEARTAQEAAMAAAAGASCIGVNNRNLGDFSVDFGTAARLRDAVPPGVRFVAESGVSSPADVASLKAIGADAVLMGEVLMRAPDRVGLLRQMREAAS